MREVYIREMGFIFIVVVALYMVEWYIVAFNIGLRDEEREDEE